MLIRSPQFEILVSNNKVEAFSTTSIPFDSLKEWQKDFKRNLYDCVSKLKSNHDEGLFAAYGNVDGKTQHTDTENLLLYNIGSGAFRKICQHYLEFTTLSSSQTIQYITSLGNTDFKHYYRYEIIPIPPPERRNSPLVSWPCLPIFSLRGERKPLQYWQWIHDNSKYLNITESYLPRHSKGYGLDLYIDTPVGFHISAYTPAKPMLDGVISAFHHMPEGSNYDELYALSSLLNCPLSQLNDTSIAVLGARKFVSLSSRIIWNPNDDLCEQIRIYLRYNKSEWRLGGTVYAL